MNKSKIKTLKKRMIGRELNQRRLARLCGVSEVFIGLLIKGERTSKRCVDVISEALEIPRDRLIRLITK